MTDEELDTLIAELEQMEQWEGSEGVYNRIAKALTDLRTERDAALAVIDKAQQCVERGEGWLVDAILDEAPTSALADRDARILEEAADEIIEITQWTGELANMDTLRRHDVGMEAADIVRARAVSRRREA